VRAGLAWWAGRGGREKECEEGWSSARRRVLGLGSQKGIFFIIFYYTHHYYYLYAYHCTLNYTAFNIIITYLTAKIRI
jgi:hypothetical protein